MHISNKSSDNNLLFVNFNQDCGCFASGTTSGFCIYNCDPLRINRKQLFKCGGIRFVEMLYRCNYLAIVPDGTSEEFPSTNLMIWDDIKKSIVITLEFNSEVYAARLRRDLIVVVLEGLIKVFTLSQIPQQLHIFETNRNPKGLCVLCANSTNSILAFPSRKLGFVDVIHLGKSPIYSNKNINSISFLAHQTAIAYLALNLLGTRLATASETGTLIRVFDTKTGSMIAERRRGAQPATIYSICFNHDSTNLCVSSDHGTVHIFSLDNPAFSRLSSFSNMIFLPKYFSSVWSNCKFTVPNGSPCICGFGDNNSIIVLCADGCYHKFTFDTKGECSLEMSAQFLELAEF